MHRVIEAEFALESFPIETNVPVSCVVNKTKQSRYYSVKTIGCHFFIHESQQTLTIGQDPSVEHVCVCRFGFRIEDVVNVFNLLQESYLSFKGLVAVPQRK